MDDGAVLALAGVAGLVLLGSARGMQGSRALSMGTAHGLILDAALDDMDTWCERSGAPWTDTDVVLDEMWAERWDGASDQLLEAIELLDAEDDGGARQVWERALKVYMDAGHKAVKNLRMRTLAGFVG